MQKVQISAEVRSGIDKKVTKSIRREGQIPAVIYGGDDSSHIAISPKSVKSLVYTPDFKIAEIAVDGKVQDCILKDIQFHPVTDEILHIDFLRLIPETPIKVELPLECVGNSPGVKLGGKLLQTVRKIRIKTTPEHLTDKLTVDISGLELGQSVRVRDVSVTEHMQVMNPGAAPVAMVEVPRSMRSAESKAALAEGGEATEEGEA